MLELNKIYCQDNVQGMKMLDDECIDLTEKHDNESWADIEIFKGRYQASTLGRISSVARTYKGRIIPTKPRVLKSILITIQSLNQSHAIFYVGKKALVNIMNTCRMTLLTYMSRLIIWTRL